MGGGCVWVLHKQKPAIHPQEGNSHQIPRRKLDARSRQLLWSPGQFTGWMSATPVFFYVRRRECSYLEVIVPAARTTMSRPVGSAPPLLLFAPKSPSSRRTMVLV